MLTRPVKPPIVITVPAHPARRKLPIARIVVGLAALALIALGYRALPSDGGAALAAIGCAIVFALVYRPTRVPTTGRVYTVWGMRLRGDVETDQWFDEGR